MAPNFLVAHNRFQHLWVTFAISKHICLQLHSSCPSCRFIQFYVLPQPFLKRAREA
ncbi:hypothetical protein MPTK2_3g00680 [Marchantia polymorpha subsp. ruderalis]